MASGRPEIDIELCKGCELCIDVCPQHVLCMSVQTNKQGFAYACYTDTDCTSCMACAVICPESAVKVFRFVKETS